MSLGKRFFVISLILLSTGLTEGRARRPLRDGSRPEREKCRLNEVGISTGYALDNLGRNREDLKVFPVIGRIGFRINPIFRLGKHRGTIQFVLEPFLGVIRAPEWGYEVGLDLFLRYSYPVLRRVSAYLEAGAGPIYLSPHTGEQGHGGFNFLDQAGAGIQVFLREDAALSVGYRYRHTSHGGFRSSPNAGIDGHSVIIGLSLFF